LSLAQWAEAILGPAIAMATPLLLAALGETFVERSGVINIGLEGIMLVGALAGAAGAYLTGQPGLGLVIGIAAGVALAGLFGVLAIYRGADQIVVGTGINILALGLTGVFFRALQERISGTFQTPAFPPVAVPGLSGLPGVGAALFQRNLLVYLALALVPLSSLVLYRTRLGLNIRATGENPMAADAAGVRVNALRFGCVLWSGALAGAAGVFLAIGHSNTFVEGMTDGRGFIALAVVIFGRWHPWGVLGAALLFGLAQGLQFTFQSRDATVPYQFFLALPYLVTLIALVLRFGRTRMPAALAQPYRRS
jgi:ABC-type uncharacterized transport system permease subunit